MIARFTNYAIRRIVSRAFFYKFFFASYTGEALEMRQSRVSKTRKEEKGEKIRREKQWFKAFEGVDESDAERGHERRERS